MCSAGTDSLEDAVTKDDGLFQLYSVHVSDMLSCLMNINSCTCLQTCKERIIE